MIDPDDPLAEHISSILSAEEIETARAEARTKFEEELRAGARKKIIADEMQRLRAQHAQTAKPGEDVVSITLDLAEHSDRITLDGMPYWHGFTYSVPRRVANTLIEVMQRGWRHQDIIDGKDDAYHYRRRYNTAISATTGKIENNPIYQRGGREGVSV